jgi:hypothetical protein
MFSKKEKKEYLAKLHEDKFFMHVLSLVKNEEEKRKIKAYAEDVYINLLQGGLASQKLILENPEKFKDIAEGKITKDSNEKIIKDK